MIALFVSLAALRRLLHPRELLPRQHAAELLSKSDDGRIRRAVQGVLTLAHFEQAETRAL
jgi:hypothetical protein